MGWKDAPLVEEEKTAAWQAAPIVEPKGKNVLEEDSYAYPPAKEENWRDWLKTGVDNAKRHAGIVARGAVKGNGFLFGLAHDALAAPVNMGIDAYDNYRAPLLEELVSGKQSHRIMPFNQSVDVAGDAIGLHRPQNPDEQFLEDSAGAFGGVGAARSLGNMMYQSSKPVVKGTGEMLRAQPGLQAVSAISGTTASHGAEQMGGGDLAQLAAGVAGSLAPGGLSYLASEGTKRIFRGGEDGRQIVEKNLSTFRDGGYGVPSAGQATERRVPRAIESGLSKAPGGAGVMGEAAEKGAENLGQRADEIADSLSPNASATKAGTTIEKGVRKFTDDFKKQQGVLYDRLDKHIPLDKPVKVDSTRQALADLNADIEGAPELSKWFKNEKIQGIEAALVKDTSQIAPGEASKTVDALPYEALKKLRTLVGKEISNHSLTSTVPRDKWKALYASISKDMEAAAAEAGPEATKAFKRANDYSAAGYSRIETHLDRVVGKDTLEKIYTAAVSPSEIKEGASTLNAVMRSIPKADQDIVRAATIRRLGTATAGKQDDAGETFSSETFLTNWNKISPEAKRILFSGKTGDADLRESLDKIAKVASNIRQGSKVFANPSGTSASVANIGLGSSFFTALGFGHYGAAATMASVPIAANQTARLMTNPDFVKWLAKNAEKPVGSVAGSLNALSKLSADMDDADREAVDLFIQTAKQ